MAPSWKTHRTIGEIVCRGFSDSEIDKLIDSEEAHDAGRYDEEIFLKQLNYVWRKWGWKGFCYYILHHVLDRVSDIIVSELCDLGERYLDGEISIEEAYELLLKNSLSRSKRDPYILSMERAGSGVINELIRATMEYIWISLEIGWEATVFFLLTDVSASGDLTSAKRALNGLIVKSVTREFLRKGRSFDVKEVAEFLEKIGREAHKGVEKCEQEAQERAKKLAGKYERILPVLEDAIKRMPNKEAEDEL